jgi:signal peptidase I
LAPENKVEYYRTQLIPDSDPKERSFGGQVIWEILTTIIPAILIALFINVYIAEAAEIEAGPSMQPNFYAGYRVMTEKISYYLHLPRRGDVVVVERPENEGNLIKRVIGLPGENIEVRNGHAFINGDPIDEPWVANFGGRDLASQRIPEDYIFIMGDNRPVSRDSREIGPVKIDSIIGRGWFVYWPIEEFEFIPSSNP